MSLVTTKKMFEAANEKHYAIGAFNINNMEIIQGIIEACKKENSAVILQVSKSALKYMQPAYLMGMVKAAAEESGLDIALHLDHGEDFEICKQCVDLGFTSVMIDASHFPLEENIAQTKEVVEYAHARGVSVEAELGRVGGQEDHVVAESMYAVPEECVRMVKETGLDCLAPALGSVHGPYHGEPKLGFNEMKEIADLVKIPLVLHGGSGIPDFQIRMAIERGTCKINVNTESQQAWTKIVREVLANDSKVYDPRKIIGPGKEGIRQVVHAKCEVFGCIGKADC